MSVPLLTNEAAQLLGVSPETVRVFERTGRLPATRTQGGVRLFDRSDVVRLAAERKAANRRPAGGGESLASAAVLEAKDEEDDTDRWPGDRRKART